jgi:predicted DNA-binding transcriptional regulator AlpA
MSDAAKHYLDQDSASQLLNISKRTLERWRRDGGGPAFVRAGLRRVLYDGAEIQRWAATRTFAHHAAEQARTAA